MKKLSLSIITLLVCTTLVYSQREYARSSITVESGFSKLENIASVSYGNWHLDYRFMLNTKFGAKLGFGYTDYYNLYIREANLQAVFNMGRVFGLEDVLPNFTVLTFGGMAITDSNGKTNDFIIHRRTHFNPVAGFQLEQRITNGLFFGVGGNVIPGVNHRPDAVNGGGVDGSILTTNKWEFNVFATIPFLRGKKEHADFYVEPKAEPSITIIDKTVTIASVNNYYAQVVKGDNKPTIEYIYFKHDKSDIDKDALANIEKALQVIKDDSKVEIIGYCSNTGNIDYNKALALRRAEGVKKELVSLGVDAAKITTEAKGIDMERDVLSIHDFARRVTIEVK